MQPHVSHQHPRRRGAISRLRAKIVASTLLLASIAAGTALAQSGSVAGSALDPQTPNESLVPAGGFRLDVPSEPSPESSYNSFLMPGGGSFGLQIYGSYNLEQQRPLPEPEITGPPPNPQP